MRTLALFVLVLCSQVVVAQRTPQRSDVTVAGLSLGMKADELRQLLKESAWHEDEELSAGGVWDGRYAYLECDQRGGDSLSCIQGVAPCARFARAMVLMEGDSATDMSAYTSEYYRNELGEVRRIVEALYDRYSRLLGKPKHREASVRILTERELDRRWKAKTKKGERVLITLASWEISQGSYRSRVRLFECSVILWISEFTCSISFHATDLIPEDLRWQR